MRNAIQLRQEVVDYLCSTVVVMFVLSESEECRNAGRESEWNAVNEKSGE